MQRRAFLLLPGILAACASTPVPVVEGPPIGYAHLTQLRLDVASVEVDPFTPNAGLNDVGRELQPTPAEAVRIMARDRLAAFGTENRARVQVVAAQILRERNAQRGGFLAAESLLRQAMFDLNTEFEFQIRRSLRPYLQDGPPGATPAAVPVEREALPPA